MSAMLGYWQIEAVVKRRRQKKNEEAKMIEDVIVFEDDYVAPLDLNIPHTAGCELACSQMHGDHCWCVADGGSCCVCGFETSFGEESCTCVELQ